MGLDGLPSLPEMLWTETVSQKLKLASFYCAVRPSLLLSQECCETKFL